GYRVGAEAATESLPEPGQCRVRWRGRCMAIRSCVFSDEVSPDFEEAVRLSVEAGAEGLELRGRMWGKSIGQIDDAEGGRVTEVCSRFGARVGVIGSPVGKCDMENAEECRQHQALFRRMAELAH